MTNPSFPAYVKIGYTDDIDDRLSRLNKSECVPYAFRLYAYYEVPKRLSDTIVHGLIDKLNPDLRCRDYVNGKKREREFYQMTPEEAYNILDAIATVDDLKHRLHKVTPTKEELNEEAEAQNDRMEMFRFSMCNIKPGDELEYIYDSSKKCHVISDKKVEYEGNEYSLSALAKYLYQKDYPLPGTHYFKYHGEKLNDIRNKILESKETPTDE